MPVPVPPALRLLLHTAHASRARLAITWRPKMGLLTSATSIGKALMKTKVARKRSSEDSPANICPPRQLLAKYVGLKVNTVSTFMVLIRATGAAGIAMEKIIAAICRKSNPAKHATHTVHALEVV